MQKVGSQEIPGVTGKFGLEVQNAAVQRLIEFCQENTLVITNTLLQKHKRHTHGHHQMVNTETLQLEMKKLYTLSKNKTGS